MSENQERRRARRQQRGLLREESILSAAGELFADVGYDRATTNMIAARAGVSPGSLYQFFPNKEAIAQAYAAAATARLHRVYDIILSPDVIGLPLQTFVDTLIDALIAFNKEYPGYLALSIASTISSPLAIVLADLRKDIAGRLEALFLARWPMITPEQRSVRGLISYRLFLALLPLALDSNSEDQQTIVREMKSVLYRYWEPVAGAQGVGHSSS